MRTKKRQALQADAYKCITLTETAAFSTHDGCGGGQGEKDEEMER